MTPEQLVKKVLAQREFNVDLGEGRKIRMRRPAEAEFLPLFVRDANGNIVGLRIEVADVKRFAVSWEGITEADIITSGASDGAPFSDELFGVVIEDKRVWCGKCVDALVSSVLDHIKAQSEAAGN